MHSINASQSQPIASVSASDTSLEAFASTSKLTANASFASHSLNQPSSAGTDKSAGTSRFRRIAAPFLPRPKASARKVEQKLTGDVDDARLARQRQEDTRMALQAQLPLIAQMQAQGKFNEARQCVVDIAKKARDNNIAADTLSQQTDVHPLAACGLFADTETRDLIDRLEMSAYYPRHIASLLASRVFQDQPERLQRAVSVGMQNFSRYDSNCWDACKEVINPEHCRLLDAIFSSNDPKYAALAFRSIPEAAEAAMFSNRPDLSRSIWKLFEDSSFRQQLEQEEKPSAASHSKSG